MGKPLATVVLSFFFTSSISMAVPLDLCPTPSFSSSGRGSHLPLFHINGKCSPFSAAQTERPSSYYGVDANMERAITGDGARLAYLSGTAAELRQASTAVGSGCQKFALWGFLVRARLGTPCNQTMFMVLDISSDHSWVPCTNCSGCAPNTPFFSPSSSSTYAPLSCSSPQCDLVRGHRSCSSEEAPAAALNNNNNKKKKSNATSSSSSSRLSPCSFNHSYGDANTSLSAVLSSDSLSLGDGGERMMSNFTFGCVSAVAGTMVPPQGLLGLGRGRLSLLSQTWPLFGGIFSYCLPSLRSSFFTGTLRLGREGQPVVSTTQVLTNPRRPALYYVNLTGVSVQWKDRKASIAVDGVANHSSFDASTGAGTVIDSGTLITRFVGALYRKVRDAYREQLRLGADYNFTSRRVPGMIFDTCFEVSDDDDLPQLTLHFPGLDWKVKKENTLIKRNFGALACLAVAPWPSYFNSSDGGLNVIASYQQQYTRVFVDVGKSVIGMAPEVCNY